MVTVLFGMPLLGQTIGYCCALAVRLCQNQMRHEQR
jgi:hypothetical protein